MVDATNKPLPHAIVHIVPLEVADLKERELYWEGQYKDKGGSFKFVHIPPGSYLLVVNPEDERYPAFPYQRTFYPGVGDRAVAQTITIGEGEQMKDMNIVVAPEFRRRVTVRVTWADGRLIEDFVYVEVKGVDNPAAMAHTDRPNLKESIVQLSLIPGESYTVSSELVCLYDRGTSKLRSDPAYLSPKDDRTELSLTIPATACPAAPQRTPGR
ncbi:MAG: hypothetical protein U0Q16_05150 [Bryobacteraceae bacterium]